MKKCICCIIIGFILGNSLFCQENEKVTFIYARDIIVLDLGSTEEDLLALVSASDGSKVSVSDINLNHVGEQNALFRAGKARERKAIRIRANKLAGLYKLSLIDNRTKDTMISRWEINITRDSAYNQLYIPDSSLNGYRIFIGPGKLIIKFNGNGSVYMPGYIGEILPCCENKVNWIFYEIKYGRITKTTYALKEFKILGIKEGCGEIYYTVILEKVL